MTRDASTLRPTPEGSAEPPSSAGPPGSEHARDVAAVRAVRQGQPDAFAGLVDAHAPRLYGLLQRFLRNEADTDDVLQETFLRAYQALDRYDASRPFYPWLRRIAVNAALNVLQRRRTRREIDDAEALLEVQRAADCTDAEVRQRELVDEIESVLGEMPPAWAAVFRLRTAEDLSYAEIAQTLEIPVGTVMSRLARARRRLAEALARRFGRRGEEES